jgi:hypothetical protein
MSWPKIFAFRVDGDLAGQLQDGVPTKLDARYMGVLANRGGNGRRVIEIIIMSTPFPDGPERGPSAGEFAST